MVFDGVDEEVVLVDFLFAGIFVESFVADAKNVGVGLGEGGGVIASSKPVGVDGREFFVMVRISVSSVSIVSGAPSAVFVLSLRRCRCRSTLHLYLCILVMIWYVCCR